MNKPFDIDKAISLIEQAVRPYPKAAMFELADEGYTSPFEQLIACIISIRTYDEVSLPVSRRLFSKARTAAEMNRLETAEIIKLIEGTSFAGNKGPQIKAIAQQLVDEYDGELPCDRALLLSFKGVGPKCAHLALGIACDAPYISVDTHVHRITNRWGYVEAKTPEKTMVALEEKLPRRYWIDINRLLVPFGKHICTGTRPHCSTCPIRSMCQQVGVTSHR
ncbi:MAG: endonuclease III [Candidatus Promineifilaceae bacterium]